MTNDVLNRECRYETLMHQVKRMLSVGLISEQEFQEIEARFRAKYKPISGGYIVQTDLLCARRRVMNPGSDHGIKAVYKQTYPLKTANLFLFSFFSQSVTSPSVRHVKLGISSTSYHSLRSGIPVPAPSLYESSGSAWIRGCFRLKQRSDPRLNICAIACRIPLSATVGIPGVTRSSASPPRAGTWACPPSRMGRYHKIRPSSAPRGLPAQRAPGAHR